MSGPYVLITGGSRGVGYALAAAWVQRGARVGITGRDPARVGAAAEALAALGAPGATIDTFIGDLAEARARDQLVTFAQGRTARLDVFVNNAAVQHQHDADADSETLASRAEYEIGANLVAPVVLSLRLLPLLEATAAVHGAATIVNVTSGLALAPRAKAPVYCGTKAGLRTFGLGLHWQLERAAVGVRVVEAMLPLVDTDMTAGRGRGKLSPDTVACAILDGIDAGRTFIPVGKVRLLRALLRLAPRRAERLLRDS